jgi:ketosteroid isomerase-like protein
MQAEPQATSESADMRNKQLAALNTMVAAVNAGDARRYSAVYAADATITIFGGDTLQGRDAIEQHEVELLQQFPGTRFAIYSTWQHGESAVVHYGVNSPATGIRPTGHEGLLFYRFLPSGLIAEERRYLDTMTPMVQMGVLSQLQARPLPVLPSAMRTHVIAHAPVERENVATVLINLLAFDAKDVRAFLAILTDDVMIDELITPTRVVGKAQAESWFNSWIQNVTSIKSDLVSIVGVGDAVLVETIVRGTLTGQLGGVSASNRPFAVHRALIVRVHDGNIGAVSAFMNGKELAESIGQWPPPESTPPR